MACVGTGVAAAPGLAPGLALGSLYTSTGIILVLFILLVIVTRTFV